MRATGADREFGVGESGDAFIFPCWFNHVKPCNA